MFADDVLEISLKQPRTTIQMQSEWDDLSHVSKNRMEKKTCFQTALRLIDQLAEEKGERLENALKK